MSSLRELLSRYHNLLCEKAAEAGIDFAASVDQIQCAGIKNPVTFREKDRKRSFIHVHEKDAGWLINFHTFDDGRGSEAVSCFMPFEERRPPDRAKKLREAAAEARRSFLEAEASALEAEAARQEAMEAAHLKRAEEEAKRCEEERRKREEAQRKLEEEMKPRAAAKREADWQRDKAAYEAAPRLSKDFAYIVRKGIPNLPEFFDVREMTAKRQFGHGSDEAYLAYALRDAAGNYVGFKRIWADGKKKKLSGARTEGSYKGAHTIVGDPSKSKKRIIYIAEGLATAVSIHLATRCVVYVADSAGNLSEVVRIAKRRNPEKTIVIVADNDVQPEEKKLNGNPGVFAALTAAKEHGVRFAIIPAIDDKKTDANDYAQKHGNEELGKALKDRTEKPSSGEIWALRMLGCTLHLKGGRNEKQRKYIEDYARATFVGWRVSVEEAARHVETVTGGLVPKNFFSKVATALRQRERARAERLLEIKDVDYQYNYEVSWNEQGHPKCPPEVIETLAAHGRLGHHIILRAPTGVGKTELAINECLKRACGPAVVGLPRVFTIDDVARRLNTAHYRHVTREDLKHHNVLTLCINSFGARRYRPEKEGEKHCLDGLHFFAMDETDALIKQGLRLGDHRTCKGNIMQLASTIRTAKYTLSCDAFAGQSIVDAIRKMDHREIVFIDVAYPEDRKKRLTLLWTEEKSFVEKTLIACLEQGETALFFSDSAAEARRVHRKILRDGVLQPSEVLLVCGTPRVEDLGPVVQFAKDPNAEAMKYKLIIYTPKIDAGLSIVVPHFKNHFGVFTGVVPVQTQRQMMGRDRTADTMLIYASDRSARARRLKLDADRSWVGENPELFDALHLLMDEAELRSLDNYRSLSMNFHAALGDTVMMMPEGLEDAAHDKEMREIRKALKEEEIVGVETAEEINEETWLLMKQRDLKTDEDVAMIRNFDVREIMCGLVERPYIEFYLRGGIRRLENLEAATSSEADVKRYDEKEIALGTSRGALWRAEDRRNAFLRIAGSLGWNPKNRFQGEIGSEDAQRALDLALSMSSDLNQMFKGIINPKKPPKCAVSFLKKFFALFGVILDKRKSNGRKVRFIKQSSLGVLLDMIERRRRSGRAIILQIEPDEPIAPSTSQSPP